MSSYLYDQVGQRIYADVYVLFALNDTVRLGTIKHLEGDLACVEDLDAGTQHYRAAESIVVATTKWVTDHYPAHF